MINFFQAIFDKIIAVVASAIIAVGIVQVPVIPDFSIVPENQPEVAGVLEDQPTNTEQEIEKLKQEIEELKAKPTPAPVVQKQPSPVPAPTPVPAPILTPPAVAPVQTPSPQTQTDSALMIAKCQADTRVLVDNYINKAHKDAEDKILPFVGELDQAIKNLEIKQAEAATAPLPDYLIGSHPSDILAYRKSQAHQYDPTISQYEKAKQDWLNKLQQVKDEAKRLFEQGYNDLYAKCLNH